MSDDSGCGLFVIMCLAVGLVAFLVGTSCYDSGLAKGRCEARGGQYVDSQCVDSLRPRP